MIRESDEYFHYFAPFVEFEFANAVVGLDHFCGLDEKGLS